MGSSGCTCSLAMRRLVAVDDSWEVDFDVESLDLGEGVGETDLLFVGAEQRG